MANHHRRNSSKDNIVSFPSTPSQDPDSDFEFGCLSPDSAVSDLSKNSPADHLFFNGRLLPHSFPTRSKQQAPTTNLLITIDGVVSRGASRTTSISSKDSSFVSSRSNSTNSSRSSVSSSSAAASEDARRRVFSHHHRSSSAKTPVVSKVVMGQLYGNSQRWQHIVPVVAPVVVLKRGDSQKRSRVDSVKDGKVNSRGGKEGKRPRRPGICRRFFRSLLVACRECHAMEPSTKDDVLQGNIKL